MNKNMSENYKTAYGQVADPTAGTRVPAGKDGRGETDALRQATGVSKVEHGISEAGKEHKGAALKAVAQQAGKKDWDNMTQPNSGGESKNYRNS